MNEKASNQYNLNTGRCAPTSRETEGGGIFLYILVGCVLFAMLLYTYSRNSGGSTSIASKGKAKTQAVEVLSFARAVNGQVDRLLLKGCSETEINFGPTEWKDAPESYWMNPTAPADNRCNVFSDAGGPLTRQTPPKGLAAAGQVSPYGTYEFKGHEAFPGHGSSTCDEISWPFER